MRGWLPALVVVILAVAGCDSSSSRTDGGADAGTDAATDCACLVDAGQAAEAAAETGGDDGSSTEDGDDAPDSWAPAGDADASAAVDALGPSDDGPLNARYVFQIPLIGASLIGDPLRRRLYVSVGEASPQHPNSLLTIDANTGAIVANTSVGDNPGSLALSDDSSVLWIGIDGGASIRRVTLTADPPDVGPLVPAPQLFVTSQTIGAIIALPGAPLSVVVSNTDGTGTAVLDDGVVRGTVAASIARNASLLAAGSAGYIYGYNSENTGFQFLSMSVSASGISDLSTTNGLISGFQNQIVYQGGHVYAPSGQVVDVSTPARPVMGGTLPGRGSLAAGPPNRLFMLTSDVPDASIMGVPTQCLVLDGTTFRAVSTIPLPAAPYDKGSGFTSNLVYVGPDTLAFLVQSSINASPSVVTGSLVVIRDPLIAAIP